MAEADKGLLNPFNAVLTNNGGTVALQPRFASPFSGSLAQRTRMRHIIHANRKRRLSRPAPTPPDEE